jgi:hypothetical protein
MYLLGVLIALGAALAFAAVGGLLIWGGARALRREVLRGFVSAAPPPAERLRTLALVALPLLGAALLSLLAAGKFVLVAFGIR